MTGRTTFALLVAGLLASALIVVALLQLRGAPGAEPLPGPTAAPSPTDPTTSPAPAPSPTEAATETLAEQIARVAGVVAQVRGLDFVEVPEAVVLSSEELEARVREELEEYEVADADLDARLLAALGVVAPGTDVRALLIDAYGEQVAGFYDPETGELVVGASSGGGRLGRVDELTLAHELQHALADQVHGLPLADDVPDGQEDESFARQALTEGDATVTMGAYVQAGFTQADRLLLFGELDDLSVGVDTTALPYLLQRQLEFPYVEGANFVASLVNAAGWEAVDAAYAAPPTSTAAILDPQRYVDGIEPDGPAARGTLAAPWEVARTVDIGAADLLYLFEAPGDDPDAGLPQSRTKALAWGGGTLDQWRDGERDAFGFAFTGDTGVLCGALGDWYDAAFPDATRTVDGEATVWDGARQDAALRCGDVVRLGIAPDVATARSLVTVGG